MSDNARRRYKVRAIGLLIVCGALIVIEPAHFSVIWLPMLFLGSVVTPANVLMLSHTFVT